MVVKGQQEVQDRKVIQEQSGDTGSRGPTGSTGPKGDTGLEGLGVWRSSTSTTTSTTSISLSSITVPSGRSVKVGDLIIANTTYSYLYRVTAVSSTTATVSYIASLRGATGATGSTGATGPAGPTGPQGPAGQNATTTSTATQSVNGLMSSTDKKKLDALPTIYKGSYTTTQALSSKTPTKIKITVPSGYQNNPIFINAVGNAGYGDWISAGASWYDSTHIEAFLLNHGDGATTGTIYIFYMLVK